MYHTSEKYKKDIYEPSTRHLLKIYIDGVEMDPKYIFKCKESHQLFPNDEFVLGSVTSKAIDLQIHKNAILNKPNKVYIESGIYGETLPIGDFNVDDIKEENNFTISMKLMDNMIKFEDEYDGSDLTYPVTLETLLKDICNKNGVELRFYFFFESR